MSWLREHCPRLARARDTHERLVREYRDAEARRTTALVEWQRVEAHCELQLVRAWATNDRGYIVERERKLAAARRQVARLSVPAVFT